MAPARTAASVKPIPLSLRVILTLSVGFGGLPFVLYVVERATGQLPSYADWQSTGSNHGPWRWELEGFSILFPMVPLFLATLGFVMLSLWSRSWRLGALGVPVIGLQTLLVYLQLSHLYWTID